MNHHLYEMSIAHTNNPGQRLITYCKNKTYFSDAQTKIRNESVIKTCSKHRASIEALIYSSLKIVKSSFRWSTSCRMKR